MFLNSYEFSYNEEEDAEEEEDDVDEDEPEDLDEKDLDDEDLDDEEDDLIDAEELAVLEKDLGPGLDEGEKVKEGEELPLEEDAEDVDYDSFDDRDEM